jgi:HTH-type transcriptional repressor of NAD biosynthesis genes
VTAAYGHGLVLGKFYPPHAGHAHLIRTAQRRCRSVTVLVLASHAESLPLQVRADWLAEDHPGVRVVAAYDDLPVDFTSAAAWTAHVDLIRPLLPGPVDAVLTSDAYGAELARRLGASWLRVDPGRQENPVSGTAVRADPERHWAELSATVRAGLTQRVVVLGAESTGSTTLAAALAADLGTTWVPEYGREHSAVRSGGLAAPWRSDEFDLIVDRQIAAEDAARRRTPRPVLVCDTDALATVVWHERYVGGWRADLEDRARAHPPALYLLTGDEIAFVDDGMRDGEHLRSAMQSRFRAVLAAQPVPWREVTGSVAERVAAARPLVDAAVAAGLRFADPLPAVVGPT